MLLLFFYLEEVLFAENPTTQGSAHLHALLKGDTAHLAGEASQVEGLAINDSHVLVQVKAFAATTTLWPKDVDEVLLAVEPALHGKTGVVQGDVAGGAGEAGLVQGEVAHNRQSLLLDLEMAMGTTGHPDDWSLPITELIFVSAWPRSVSYWFAKVPAL